MTLRGMSTVSFFATDLEKAGAWYTTLFGVPPYFVVPGGYLEFRIGDDEDEFGIVDASYAPHDVTRGPSGAVLFWHVDDVEAIVARLLELGATIHEPVRERGPGFVTASVVDPFGNVLGVMHNAHWAERHAVTKP